MANQIKNIAWSEFKPKNGSADDITYIVDKNIYSQMLSLIKMNDVVTSYVNQITAEQYFIIFTNDSKNVTKTQNRVPGLYLIVVTSDSGITGNISLYYHDGVGTWKVLAGTDDTSTQEDLNAIRAQINALIEDTNHLTNTTNSLDSQVKALEIKISNLEAQINNSGRLFVQEFDKDDFEGVIGGDKSFITITQNNHNLVEPFVDNMTLRDSDGNEKNIVYEYRLVSSTGSIKVYVQNSVLEQATYSGKIYVRGK